MAQMVEDTEAEGPGRRFAVWVQGCTLRCPGCCNPELFAVDGGHREDVRALAARVLATPGVEGLTVLGGEPFQQAPAVAALGALVRAGGRSVMVFTGYTLEELRAGAVEGAEALLAQVDLLVDGRYEARRPERTRRWIGSANQRLHFLTDRYREGDPRLEGANTVELRWGPSGLQVNGWPSAARVWRRGP